jgi:hypothetical protein
MTNFFCNRSVDKGELKRLIAWFLATRGSVQTALMVDELKRLGFHYATYAGISIGIEDLKIPPARAILLAYANKEISENEYRFFRGKISAVERSQKVIDIWNATSELIKEEIVDYFKQTDRLNPVYMMAFSGARGNLSQVRQLVGMRGLMSDPKGEIIDLPIKSNFRKGLTVTEYIISCYGARKGLVDTALKTANSGYLTRRLVDVAQAIIIKELDCGTKNGISLDDLYKDEQIVFPLEKRLLGRVLLNPLRIGTRTLPNYNLALSGNKKNKKLILHSFTPKNRDICKSLANELVKIYPEVKIKVRSPLTCKTVNHCCKLCYGWSLAQCKMVDLGEAIGIIAAQSIGEPGTQLTMRTFHTGGVFSTEVGKRIYSPHQGILSYSLEGAQKIRTEFGQQGVYFQEPLAITIEKLSKEKTLLTVPRFSILFLKPGTQVYWKQVLAEVSTLPKIYGQIDTREGFLTRKEVYATEAGDIAGGRGSEKSKLILKLGKNPWKNTKGKSSSLFLLQSKILPRSSTPLGIRLRAGDFSIPATRERPKNRLEDILPYHYSFPNQFKTNLESFIVVSQKKNLLVLGNKSKNFNTNQIFSFESDTYKKQTTKKLKEQGPSNVILGILGNKSLEQPKSVNLLRSNPKLNTPLNEVLGQVEYEIFKSHPKKGENKRRARNVLRSGFTSDIFDQGEYCQRTLNFLSKNETYSCWLYFPNENQLPKTVKQYRQFFTRQFSYVNAYESVWDQLSFPEMVFTELLFPKSMGWPDVPLIVSFRKLLQFPSLQSSAFLNRKPAEVFQKGPALAVRGEANREYTKVKKELKKEMERNRRTLKSKTRRSKKQELIFNEQNKYCFIQREKNQMQLFFRPQLSLLGRLLVDGSTIKPGLISPSSGKVEQIRRDSLLLRNGLPYLCPAGGKRSIRTTTKALVYEGTLLLTLFYIKSKTEDIVQGLPKVEELFEARRTKALQPLVNNSHDQLVNLFEKIKTREYTSVEQAAKESILRIQQDLVAGVQRVYQSQGVTISDKHIEIITKQMTSRVFIENGGLTSFLYGDLVEFSELETCCQLANQYNLAAPIYEPMVIGITKAALRTESFLSAASFQETTRVLTQASLQTKYDFFDGLKENVIIGRLLPAGTGFSAQTSILSLGKAPTWKAMKEKAKKKGEAIRTVSYSREKKKLVYASRLAAVLASKNKSLVLVTSNRAEELRLFSCIYFPV